MDKEKLKKAYLYAYERHLGQSRRGGLPYITHPVAVAERVWQKGYGDDYIVTSLFHDLLEDTDATEEQILQIGGEEVLKAVKLLTKYEGYDMKTYVENIKTNEIAFVVKGADRVHNLTSAFVCDEDFKRRYAIESADWYLDFDEEIPKLIYRLAKDLTPPIEEVLEKLKAYKVD